MHRSRPCAGGSCKRAARPPAGLLRLKQQEAQAEVKQALLAAQQLAQERARAKAVAGQNARLMAEARAVDTQRAVGAQTASRGGRAGAGGGRTGPW